MTDESLRALHGELVSELRRAPSPTQWWLTRHQAISLLKGNGDCQEFRVRAAIMGKKENPYGPTQSPAYS